MAARTNSFGNFSRRDFLKVSCAVSLGMVLPACGIAQTQDIAPSLQYSIHPKEISSTAETPTPATTPTPVHAATNTSTPAATLPPTKTLLSTETPTPVFPSLEQLGYELVWSAPVEIYHYWNNYELTRWGKWDDLDRRYDDKDDLTVGKIDILEDESGKFLRYSYNKSGAVRIQLSEEGSPILAPCAARLRFRLGNGYKGEGNSHHHILQDQICYWPQRSICDFGKCRL